MHDLWRIREVKGVLGRQMENGAWKYPAGGRRWIRSSEDYNQLETYRMLGVLVEKYGLNSESPAVARAAEFLLSHQTSEGDLRGIYGSQYSPNYTAAIIELLIKAGYEGDPRIDKAFRWLLSIRQNDGGWAIPLRTLRLNWAAKTMSSRTFQGDKSQPFSHLVTGVVLRAFAAHSMYRKSQEGKNAGRLLASRFFLRDVYPDRQGPDFWTKFSYPFWFTDLLSSLDSLSLLGFKAEGPQIRKGLQWFATRQQRNGGWQLPLLRTRDKDLKLWINLAICRVFRRFY